MSLVWPFLSNLGSIAVGLLSFCQPWSISVGPGALSRHCLKALLNMDHCYATIRASNWYTLPCLFVGRIETRLGLLLNKWPVLVRVRACGWVDGCLFFCPVFGVCFIFLSGSNNQGENPHCASVFRLSTRVCLMDLIGTGTGHGDFISRPCDSFGPLLHPLYIIFRKETRNRAFGFADICSFHGHVVLLFCPNSWKFLSFFKSKFGYVQLPKGSKPNHQSAKTSLPIATYRTIF